MASSDPQYEVLDDQGHKTGQLLDLPTIHKQELWHEVVNVWIMNSQAELLMQLRAPGVELSPNVWDVTIGTHLRLQEEPVDAALRSLRTELGLTALPEQLKHLFNVQSANPMPNGITHKTVGHVFMMQQDIDTQTLIFDPEKISKFAWVPLPILMAEIGSAETQSKYFPRANNYYPQLFKAFESWM
jgi:Isopentenyldiphosphate isomerase